MEDIKQNRRRHAREKRKSKFPLELLHTMCDVEQTLPQLQPVAYDEPLAVGEDVSVIFREAGHILASAMLEVNITRLGNSCRIIFSEDIGQWDKPLIHDPTVFDCADYVVTESTYGNRDHQDGGDIKTQMARVISLAVARGGNVIIPTFAVERAQELMYYIGCLVRDDRIPRVPVYLDSPMAVNVTEICTAGRIKHRLRRDISREESAVLFVRYQAHGTLGRLICNCEDNLRTHGCNYVVRAQIAEIVGFSGHADRSDLLK